MVSRPSPPPMPDPMANAQAQMKVNKESLEDSAKYNQHAQVTPWGNVTWKGEIGTPERTQTTVLNAADQANLDKQRMLGGQLLAALTGEGNVGGGLVNDIFSSIGTKTEVGPEAREAVENATYERALARMQPQFTEQRQNLENTLVQRGFGIDSEAYRNEIDRFEDTRNRQMTDLALASVLAGANEHQRQYELAEMSRRAPLMDMGMLMGHVQPVSMPQMPSLPQYAMSAPDVMGMAGSNYASAANAHAAQVGGMYGMLGSLGGGLLGGLLSDRRAKRRVRKIGTADNGLPIYAFRYRSGGPTQIGFIAQDVERRTPEAVTEIGGMKHVNYDIAVM